MQIRRDMKPLLNQNAEYELCFGNPFYVKDYTNGYNIRSSGFNIFGVAETVYLADQPTSDTEGTLFLFKLVSTNAPVIVAGDIGTIDYERAEIMIKSINITGTSKTVQDVPIIEVSACPQSNDIVGLQDLYLQLDITNSTVDMISDSITSGENSAGTLYTATSSYSGDKIARLTETESVNTTLTSSDTYILGSPNTLPY